MSIYLDLSSSCLAFVHITRQRMSIIKQLDKRSGIKYAYESISWWDKEKKQSRSTRRLIGRVVEENGEIKLTDDVERMMQKTGSQSG